MDANADIRIDEPVKEHLAVNEQPKLDTARKIIKDGDIRKRRLANDVMQS